MNTTCLKVACKISFCVSVLYEIQVSKYLEFAHGFKPKFLVVCIRYLQYTSEIRLENNIKNCAFGVLLTGLDVSRGKISEG